VYNNYLLIGESGDERFLLKVDLDEGPVIQDSIPVDGAPLFLFLDGDDLYITEDLRNKITRINLSETPYQRVDVVPNILQPTGLAVYENNLYVAQFDQGIVSKISLDDSLATPKEFLTDLVRPGGMTLNGPDLYIAEFGFNRIVKVDLSDTAKVVEEVVNGIAGPWALALQGDDLYFTEFAGGTVKMIDITEANPTVTTLASGLDRPNGLAITESELFISERAIGRILRISFNTTSLDLISDESIRLYPNPVVDFVHVETVGDLHDIEIYDLAGRLLVSREISPGQALDLRSLPAGVYHAKVDRDILKLVKQ
jgi:DNA-binding beta-propeller fold protein YncE